MLTTDILHNTVYIKEKWELELNNHHNLGFQMGGYMGRVP